jgi:C-terminal region of band_7
MVPLRVWRLSPHLQDLVWLQEAQINAAIGESETITRRSQATAASIRIVSESINTAGGTQAVAMHLAQQYVEAFGRIAKAGNTMILPADAGNVAAMVAQASAVFGNVAGATSRGSARGGEPAGDMGASSDGDSGTGGPSKHSGWTGFSDNSEAQPDTKASSDAGMPSGGLFSLQYPPLDAGPSLGRPSVQ